MGTTKDAPVNFLHFSLQEGGPVVHQSAMNELKASDKVGTVKCDFDSYWVLNFTSSYNVIINFDKKSKKSSLDGREFSNLGSVPVFIFGKYLHGALGDR